MPSSAPPSRPTACSATTRTRAGRPSVTVRPSSCCSLFSAAVVWLRSVSSASVSGYGSRFWPPSAWSVSISPFSPPNALRNPPYQEWSSAVPRSWSPSSCRCSKAGGPRRPCCTGPCSSRPAPSPCRAGGAPTRRGSAGRRRRSPGRSGSPCSPCPYCVRSVPGCSRRRSAGSARWSPRCSASSWTVPGSCGCRPLWRRVHCCGRRCSRPSSGSSFFTWRSSASGWNAPRSIPAPSRSRPR